MNISPESLIQYPKTTVPYLDPRLDYPENSVYKNIRPVSEGIVNLPAYLGGGELSIEGFDRTLLQDRALRYALLGNGREAKLNIEIDFQKPNNDLDLQKSFQTVLQRHPETALFDLITVLRGLEPVVELLHQDDAGKISDPTKTEQLEFIERYKSLEKMVEQNIDNRYKRTTDEEIAIIRNGGKTPKIFKSYVLSWSERNERANRTKEYNEKLARIKDQRSEEALQIRLEELHDKNQKNPDKIMLVELLKGSMPFIRNHRSAIHAMNALVIRADYLPKGIDLPAELIQRVRNAASLALSHSTLTNDNPLGRGAYRSALEERHFANLRRARHTTGNPPENTPDKYKMTPVLPWNLNDRRAL